MYKAPVSVKFFFERKKNAKDSDFFIFFLMFDTIEKEKGTKY